MNNIVEKTKSKIFYSDSNMTRLPIFTASKGIKPIDRIIKLNDGKTMLYISYGDKVPTIFDRKVQHSIDYLFYNRYKDHTFLFEKATEKIEKETQKYLDHYNANFSKNKKTKENLDEAEIQQITYTSMKILKEEFNLHLTLSDLNNQIFLNYRDVNSIMQSLKTLSETRIKRETTYSIAGEKVVLEISEMPLIEYSVIKEKNKKKYTISLNPFTLFNIIMKDYIDFDLNFLLSFKKPIAARLAEYFKPLFYGSRKYQRISRTFSYSELCKYLLISEHTSKSLIMQQMKDSFEELKQKGVIFHWCLDRGLFGWEIDVWFSIQFFENYYNQIDNNKKAEIETKFQDLIQYDDFNDQINNFINSIENMNLNDIPKKYRTNNWAILKAYYGRYLILEGEFK